MSIQNNQLTIPVAALDVGYFSTKGAAKPGNAVEYFTFPSQCARVTGDQIVSVGMNALSGVNVDVNGSRYFVGPDSVLNAKGRESRSISETFVNTDEYKALFLGGIHYILRCYQNQIKGKKKVVITRLVAGLPMNTFYKLIDNVRVLMEGSHMIPSPENNGDIEVLIKACTVIPQPQGAMITSGLKLAATDMKEYYGQNILVIDMGGGTTDFLLSTNKKVINERSGAYQKGVIACVYAICDSINKGLRDDPLVIQRIDEALRSKQQSFKLSGKTYEIKDLYQHVRTIINECLNSVLTKVSSLTSVDRIIFTGGGGKLLYEEAKKVWSEYTEVMTVDENPVFANVCGFYYLGELLNG